jgi:sterol desaturase/sphingolipid hydroxylase (fatty acid hydroxylase superfamily)
MDAEGILAGAGPVAAAIALAALFVVEGLVPIFEHRTRRLRDAIPNLAMGLINGVFVGGLFSGAILLTTELARANGFGVLHWLERTGVPIWLVWVFSFVAIDLFAYGWHVAAHKIPALWRFHAVHHSDPHVDASTALRFHSGEVILECAAMVVILPILGVTVPQLLLYKLILVPVALFHHSNVRMPARLDRVLRAVLVTPWMHWVHHSRTLPETDSNYAAVLPWWDMLFGTYRIVRRPHSIEFGLDTLPGVEQTTLKGMMLTPVRGVPKASEWARVEAKAAGKRGTLTSSKPRSPAAAVARMRDPIARTAVLKGAACAVDLTSAS